MKLSRTQVAQFGENGVLVVEDLLDADEPAENNDALLVRGVSIPGCV